MNSWLVAFIVIIVVALLPFFLIIWNLVRVTYRSVRHVTPAEPPAHIPEILQPAIAELVELGFQDLGYYQIQRPTVNDENADFGILLYDQQSLVYAGVSIPQITLNSPPVNIAFTSFFSDQGYFSTLNTKLDELIKRLLSQPQPEICIFQYLEFADISTLWRSHQAKLQELCLTRQPLALDATEYIAAIERNTLHEIRRLVSTKEMIWVEPDKTHRMSWPLILRAAWIYFPQTWAGIFAAQANQAAPNLELEIEQFQAQQLQARQQKLSPKFQSGLLLGTLALFVIVYASTFSPESLMILVGVLLLHEGGHVLAMKWFGYRDVTMLFIPFLGALATAKKEDASLNAKVWISLAGPLPGLILGIGLAIAFPHSPLSWLRPLTWTLIGLNLFNLLPVYPLDGGQVADLLLFSGNPYLGVVFKSLGVGLLILLGIFQPVLLIFALLIALSIPHSFRVAKLQNLLQKQFRQDPPSDRTDLIRHIFTSLQQPPYAKFAFVQKSAIAKSILDSQKERSASWLTRLGLSVIYIISLIGGILGGLYAVFPNPQAWGSMAKILSYIGKDPNLILQERSQADIQAANRQLQINPQDVGAYTERGRAYMNLRNLPAALADANQVIKLAPQSEVGYALRGQIKRLQKDRKGSEADSQIVKVLLN